jgi:hypothetical protein
MYSFSLISTTASSQILLGRIYGQSPAVPLRFFVSAHNRTPRRLEIIPLSSAYRSLGPSELDC